VPFSGDNFVAVAMRHVNEPVPSVLDRRPDCPVRLDLAIQRAMSKDPEDRLSMDDFVLELEACLAEVDGRGDEGATMIVPAARPPRRPKRKRPRRELPMVPLLLIAGLIAISIGVGAYLGLRNGGPGGGSAGPSGSKRIQLSGVAGYDPQGNNGDEHSSYAPRATDHNRSTAWTTEQYNAGGFAKDGVGLVLKAPQPVALARLSMQAGGTSFEAQIKASNSPSGGFVDVSGSDWKPVSSQATFAVDTAGKKYRYYMVWLRLPTLEGQAQIYEVTART
jgi:serine/threonine-protein kinase